MPRKTRPKQNAASGRKPRSDKPPRNGTVHRYVRRFWVAPWDFEPFQAAILEELARCDEPADQDLLDELWGLRDDEARFLEAVRVRSAELTPDGSAELWRPIPGHGRFEISGRGRIRPVHDPEDDTAGVVERGRDGLGAAYVRLIEFDRHGSRRYPRRVVSYWLGHLMWKTFGPRKPWDLYAPRWPARPVPGRTDPGTSCGGPGDGRPHPGGSPGPAPLPDDPDDLGDAGLVEISYWVEEEPEEPDETARSEESRVEEAGTDGTEEPVEAARPVLPTRTPARRTWSSPPAKRRLCYAVVPVRIPRR
jgi:hypothetical protein